MMMRSARKQRGYSLLEVLIALTILIIGIIAVYRLFPLSMKQARIAQEKIVASELADARMARLRTVGAANLMVMGFANRNYMHSNFCRGDIQALRSAAAMYEVYDLQENFGMFESYTTSLQRMAGASEIYLQRVLFSVEMHDGRTETFVTYVTEQ
jgi:prepilin-type N-terminal cleavage/methylation domain-containing protein